MMLRSLKEKDFLHPFVIWFIILLWYVIFAQQHLPSLESKIDNFITEQSFWFFSEMPKEAEEITIVAIDEASRQRLNRKWPWKRSVTAQLISAIASFSPRTIGLDIVFAGKSEEEEDQKLVSAFKSHPNIVLGYVVNKDYHEEPLKEFIDATSSLGFVNKPLQGEVLDKTRTYYVNSEKDVKFSQDIEILRNYFGLDEGGVTAYRDGVLLQNKYFIPSLNGITPLNYLVYQSHFTTIPASMVLENKVNPQHFKDKIVLVGATDPLMHDEYLTPLGVFPGVTIVANSLVMHLSKRFIYNTPLWQNLLFSFFLGFIILFSNQKLRVLFSSLFTLLVSGLTYLSFLYLRGQDIHFHYLTILFSGTLAYSVTNLYRYLNLVFVSNQIKNLAITDPSTGLYSPRYFLLQLNDKLKSKKDLTFFAVKIGNYKKLSLDLSFEQIKQLIRLFSEHLQSEVTDRFKAAMFSNLSNEIHGVVIERARKEEIESFIPAFLKRTERKVWEVEDKKSKIVLQGCMTHKAKEISGNSDDIICQMEEQFKNINGNQLVIEELQKSADQKGRTKQKDILEFITYDMEERNRDLEKSLKDILDANKKLDQFSWGTLQALSRTVDAKSRWTAGHSSRVTQMALKIGRIMGLNKEELIILQKAGFLHDIGKIATPQEIIDKPGKLTDAEYDIMREHPAEGMRILQPIKAYADLIDMVAGHHEWFNGNGYPKGLAGEEISLGGRILATADVYDALISDRPYRKGMPFEKVISIIEEGSGTQFDPKVVEAFLEVMAQERKMSEDRMNDQSSLSHEVEIRTG